MAKGAPIEDSVSIELRTELIGPGHADRPAVLRLLFDQGGQRASVIDDQVRLLEETVRRQGLKADLLLACRRDDRLVNAAMAIESPGRTALVFLSPTTVGAAGLRAGNCLLREIQAQAWRRDLVLLQALLPQGDAPLAVAYRDAGFRYLAELIYLDRSIDDGVFGPREFPKLTYSSYSDALGDKFIAVLDATYADSLDCCGLTGLRATSDVLLSHRHTGVFDPGLWFLALHRETPVGVLLLSGVPGRDVLEIVYMGVVASSRGAGLGDALISLALDVARRRDVSTLTLAVDQANTFARSLYARWGFVESARRRAWIARRSF